MQGCQTFQRLFSSLNPLTTTLFLYETVLIPDAHPLIWFTEVNDNIVQHKKQRACHNNLGGPRQEAIQHFSTEPDMVKIKSIICKEGIKNFRAYISGVLF